MHVALAPRRSLGAFARELVLSAVLWISALFCLFTLFTLPAFAIPLTQSTSFASGGSQCGIGYDSAADTIWLYTCFGSEIVAYDTSGNQLNSLPSQGGPANDVDIDIADTAFEIAGRLMPPGTILFMNGELGSVEVYAINPQNGAVLIELDTAFGLNHVVGGSYHRNRNTYFVVQDNVPNATERNRIAELDALTGRELARFETAPYVVSFGDLDVCSASGNLFVVSSGESSIAEYSPEGVLLEEHELPTGVSSLSGIAINDRVAGQAWVSSNAGPVTLIDNLPCGRFTSSATPQLLLNDVVAFETDNEAIVEVLLSDPPLQTEVAFSYQTEEGTALFGDDFTFLSGSLNVSGNTTIQRISIPLRQDTVDELAETFTLQLQPISGLSLPRESLTVTVLDRLGDPVAGIAASILPASRSVQVGDTATAFASIVNVQPGSVVSCGLRLPSGTEATFSFQPTDPLTNLPVGLAFDTPSIASGAIQTYVMSITPYAAFNPLDLAIVFDCADGNFAGQINGVNTFRLAASTTPSPDLIALTTVVDLVAPEDTTTLFAVASSNLGSTGEITVSTDNSALDAELLICETDPALGSCSSDISAEITLNYPADSSRTFAVFVSPNSVISNDPAQNRIFIKFADASGRELGSTSTAVRSR